MNLLHKAIEDPTRSYPSCLLLGFTRSGRALHLVAAYDEVGRQAVVVTVYQPDPRKWEDYRRRRQ